MKNIVVFDNGGETFDRFTIINKSNGEMIGASEQPFHPQGFGQYCGNIAWDYFTKTVGANYLRRMETEDPKHYKKIMALKTKEIIKEFTNEGDIGKVIDFNTLPDDVKHFARERFSNLFKSA
jgi:hypothetical protein